MTDESTRALAAALPAPRGGSTVGGELRALAVAAVLRGGESIAAAARRFGPGKTTSSTGCSAFASAAICGPTRGAGNPRGSSRRGDAKRAFQGQGFGPSAESGGKGPQTLVAAGAAQRTADGEDGEDRYFIPR